MNEFHEPARHRTGREGAGAAGTAPEPAAGAPSPDAAPALSSPIWGRFTSGSTSSLSSAESPPLRNAADDLALGKCQQWETWFQWVRGKVAGNTTSNCFPERVHRKNPSFRHCKYWGSCPPRALQQRQHLQTSSAANRSTPWFGRECVDSLNNVWG